MSKHRPDPKHLSNELAGASSFFKPSSERPARSETPPAIDPAPNELISEHHVRPGRPGRVAKRSMVRHPFELYLDQIERLRGLAQVEKEHGGVGSMSKMVRDAIDRLLEEHERQQ